MRTRQDGARESIAQSRRRAARTNAKRGPKILHCLGASIAAALLYRHRVQKLRGRAPDQALLPLSLDALHLPDSVPVSVPSDLLHQRPDILAAEAAVRATADEAGAAAASMFPSLTLSASYGRAGRAQASIRSDS